MSAQHQEAPHKLAPAIVACPQNSGLAERLKPNHHFWLIFPITYNLIMVFVFISARDREVLGFTADQTGGNLPAAYAP